MVERTAIIVNETGIHARPASEFTKIASKFSSKVSILKGDKQANAKSIINIMSMGLFKGIEITIRAEGEKDEISEENIKIVKELRERGILFCIATGRLDTMIKPYLRQIGNNNPVISCNGALVRNVTKGEFYHSQIIKRENFLKVIDICKANKLIFAVYCEYTVYSESIEGRIKYFEKRNEMLCEEEKVAIKIVDDIYTDLDEKVFKVLVTNDNSQLLERVKEEINKIPGVEACRSAPSLLDIMAAGVTKGNALKDLAETLKIKREEIIAIGDNHNDISMLEYAGYAIAVGNAEQAVKDIADLITVSNDEDGVAKALREVLLYK